MRAALPHASIPVQDVQAQFAAVASCVRSVKDIHVAACAQALIAGRHYPGTKVISLVSRNVRDFKVRALADLNIEVRRPDVFLKALCSRNLHGVAEAFLSLRLTLRSQPSPAALLERLAADGQVQTAACLHAALESGEIQL